MRMVRLLVLLVLFGSLPIAASAGPIQSGDVVRFSDEPGNTGGGEFKLTDVSNAADWIITFCLQKTEYMNFSSDFIVGSITDHTLTDPAANGGDANGEDQISSWTAWLYTQFTDQTLSKYAYNGPTSEFASRQDSANALQHAFWGFEGEELLDNNNFYVKLALANTPQNFGLGDVRVLNIYAYSATAPGHIGAEAQDQLTRVPEPSTMALMGVGLFSLCVRRRQKNA